jgi:predicted MFS family arabinose efflux permease
MVERIHSGDRAKFYSRLILPSLVLSRFAIQPPQILLSLLLIDIGLSFGISVGVMGQISTVYSMASFIAALLMAALSIRFKHKNLLLTGLGLRVIAAIGCTYSSMYGVLATLYVLNGFGTALVAPMTVSLTAEHLPSEKRASAIGWIITGMALSYVVGSLAINYISGIGGWRLPYLIFVLPTTLISFILVLFFVPTSVSSRLEDTKVELLDGLKGIIANRSAIACLIGLMFQTSAFNSVGTYSASYLRQSFGVSPTFASLFFMSAAICYALGSQVAGKLMNRMGSKRLWIISSIISAVGMIVAMLGIDLWLSLVLIISGFGLLGMAFTASNNLTLIQVPNYRGTMMSLFSAANSLGLAIGAAVGGIILISFNYSFLGIGIGVFILLSAITVHTFVVESISQ